jgi:hypothetical protein
MKLMTVFWTALCVAFLSGCQDRQERKVTVDDLFHHDNTEPLKEPTAYYYTTTRYW